MAHVITGACIDCGACLGVCPEDCISMDYVVDAPKCTDCGACARICPVAACVPGPMKAEGMGAPAAGGGAVNVVAAPSANIEP